MCNVNMFDADDGLFPFLCLDKATTIRDFHCEGFRLESSRMIDR